MINVSQTNKENNIHLKAKSSFLWSSGIYLIRQIISWILTLFTAKILLPEDYGIAAMPGTILPYLALIASFEIGKWIVHTPDLKREEIHSAQGIVFISCIVVSSFFYLSAPLLADFYKVPETVFVFRFMSILFIIQAFQVVPEALLRRELKFKELSIISSTTGTLQGVTALILAKIGYGYWALIYGIFIQRLTSTILLNIKSKYLFKVSFKLENQRKALKYGLSATAASICFILYSTVDDIVVGRLFGEKILGYYTLAFLLSQLPVSKIQGVIGPLNIAYYSRLKENGENHQKALFLTSNWVYLLASPALIGLIIIAPEAVDVVLGKKWLPMVKPLRVLCIVAILQSITSNIAHYLDAIGKPNIVFKYNAISAFLLSFLFISLGNTIGLRGIYLGWLFGYLIIFSIIMFYTKKYAEINLVEFFTNLKKSSGIILITATLPLITKILIDYFALFGRFHNLATVVICTLLGLCPYIILVKKHYGNEIKQLFRA